MIADATDLRKRRQQPRMNRRRRFPVQLLVDDGLRQRLERRLLPRQPHRKRPRFGDELRQLGIGSR